MSETLRDRTRRAVQSEISAAAMSLFTRRGFDDVTIDEIAAASGISRRSFFRYFATKEDIVLGDLEALGERVRGALEAVPIEESPWTAMRAALVALESTPSGETLAVSRLYATTPSLRARHLEKHHKWLHLLAPNVALRNGRSRPDHRDLAIVAACLACLDIAVDEWTRLDGKTDPEALYDEAIAALRTGSSAG